MNDINTELPQFDEHGNPIIIVQTPEDTEGTPVHPQ
jgi:hypothetical protein